MCSKLGVSIKWLSVTCFEIRCEGVTVVSDPFVTDCDSTELTWEAIENCDIICLSHSHFDHILDIPRLVKKFRPLVLCGEQTAMPLASWLNYSPFSAPREKMMGLFLDVLRITEENKVCMHMKIDMPISAVKLCCA